MGKDFSREDLIEALGDLLDPRKSEAEQDLVFQRIGQKTLDPQWSDHIFHSDAFYDGNGNIDLERVADKILGYEPIRLG